MAHPPLFVIGRQHSGNTMLAAMLGRAEGVVSFEGEGTFYENLGDIRQAEGARRGTLLFHSVRHGAGLDLPEGTWPAVRAHLEAAGERGDDLETMYLRAMDEVTRAAGGQRWVQKATSYVFSARQIWESAPGAQFVFLLRNPLDIGASLVRRGSEGDLLRMALGWRRGVAAAEALAAEAPARFTLARYEDLVVDPEPELRRLCAFADVPYEDQMLGVAHLNRAETPYNTEHEASGSGLDPSRRYYFADVLRPSQVALVRAVAGADAIARHYPELADATQTGVADALAAAGEAGRGVVRLASSQVRALAVSPGKTWRRLVQRTIRSRA